MGKTKILGSVIEIFGTKGENIPAVGEKPLKQDTHSLPAVYLTVGDDNIGSCFTEGKYQRIEFA